MVVYVSCGMDLRFARLSVRENESEKKNLVAFLAESFSGFRVE